MNINLEKILHDYQQAEPKRAAGGLYALSGFDFQLRLYLAELFEELVKPESPQQAGEIFVEALSDIAKQEPSQLVLIQVKRTLTRDTLKKAAEEALAIDALLAEKYPMERPQICFQVAALNVENSVSWADLLQDKPELQPLWNAGRLHPTRQEKDPKWRAITALWHKVEKPYDLFNVALERVLRRTTCIEDARATRDDICERYTQLRLPPSAEQASFPVWVDRLPDVEGEFFGREAELAALDEALFGDDIRVIQFIAAGGTGKTKLLRHWLNQRKEDTPKRIVWSFYSQGAAEDKQISSTPFFSEALEQLRAEKTRFNSEAEKGEYLANLLIQQRCLLVLDGLEPLQHVGKGMDGQLKDRAIATLLQKLAAKHGSLCVVTTRIRVKELGDRPHVQEIPLQNLRPEDGVALLQSLNVQGSKDELGKAVGEYGCHALALHLLGNAVATYLDGDIRQRDTLTELIGATQYADSERHAFKVMQSYQHWLKDTPELQLLYLLGLFDHPIETKVLDVLWQAKIPNLTQHIDPRAWKPAIENLRSKHRLLSAHEGNASLLDCHPLIREYFGRQLQTQQATAWQLGHKKLYEHYKSSAKYQPDTLTAMQPLFSAVAHGCAAGLHEKVWIEIVSKRIQRGDKFYLSKALGGIGDELAVFAHFFSTPWCATTSILSPKMTAALLANTGFNLTALGRLREALPAIQAGLSMAERQPDKVNASIAAQNLIALQLALGQLSNSINTAQRAMRHAEKLRNMFQQRITAKCCYAHALHQTGQTAQAMQAFQDGERLQSIYQRGFPRLYSAPGYWYNTCLLARGGITEVKERAQYALTISEKHNLPVLDVARHKLMLGKVFLAQTDFPQAEDWLQQALAGLRSASDQDELLDGLLTRAALYRQKEQFPEAHDDLQEVYDLATPSGMQLHLTDYHLESARLALAEGLPEQAKAHVREAERLIAETGYHRRDQELAELQARLTTPI